MKHWFLISLMLLVVAPWAGAVNVIQNMHVITQPNHIRVVWDLLERTQHQVFELKDPNRVVIDLDVQELSQQFNLQKFIKQVKSIPIRYAKHQQKKMRFVFEVPPTKDVNIFQKDLQKGAQIILDMIVSLDGAEEIKSFEHRPFIIAIDPGHGGKDPGAIGPSGTQEKNVTLDIARSLARQINRHPSYRAIVTRNKDVFIPLKSRVSFAREHGADLLMSIHADSYHSPKVSGASIFVLSDRGASSESAQAIANNENQIELISGVDLENKDDFLAGILRDLTQTATRVASKKMGDLLIHHLSKVTKMHKTHLESARFLVLKSPDVPSVLVEVGFISNPEQEKQLKQRVHQKVLASALYEGIHQYFKDKPMPVATPKTQWALNQSYQVKPGDTLSGIAWSNGVSVNELKSFNHLDRDNIYVGQMLLIPFLKNHDNTTTTR